MRVKRGEIRIHYGIMIITCYRTKNYKFTKRKAASSILRAASGKEHMAWKTAFGYLPINYNTVIGTVENITQRTCFKNNLKGNKVKIKFSNKYGKEKLVLDEVVIGTSQNGRIVDGVKVTHEKQQKIVLRPGEEFYSDELDLCCKPGTDLAVSIYIREKNDIMSACCAYSGQCWHTNYETGNKNLTEPLHSPKDSADVFSYAKNEAFKPEILAGICEIQVLTMEEVCTVCMFGDSITHMSFYSGALTDRLFEKYPGKITVVNRGIGGNRMLLDSAYVEEFPGHNACAGRAALKRFEEDVFGTESPDVILFLEGVNDLMHPYFLKRMEELPSLEQMKNAMEKFAEIAHGYGSKIYFGTIMPFAGQEDWQGPQGERIRHELNQWMMTTDVADGAVDFENIVADKERPAYMKEEYHLGDGLHPNNAGGTAMADLVMQKIFNEIQR